MSLYEFVGLTEKITKSADLARVENRSDANNIGTRRGRPEEPRGQFAEGHSLRDSHLLRKRVVWVVPVMLGDRFPRHDRSLAEKEGWARAVLTLFLPWREPKDLKYQGESWADAYDRQLDRIPLQHRSIIANLNVLCECKDARDKATHTRRT
ncbi:hypothetical protein C8Q76DRAFT_630222, partial [Earliella scabrosa]